MTARQELRNDRAAAATATDPGVGLIIEHTTTVDMPDGQPLPPYINDDVVCTSWTERTRARAGVEFP
jgi:hypothetical protein